MNIPVIDPFHVIEDSEMTELALALDPQQVQKRLTRTLPRLIENGGLVRLDAIRVTRYKPARRCVIEYDVHLESSTKTSDPLTLIGKVRAKRYGNSSYRLLADLWNTGFPSTSQDGISVPEPLGVIPKFRMWVQRKVPGSMFSALLTNPDCLSLDHAKRIAEASHKIHCANVPTEQTHTMADELGILHERLPLVAKETPAWTERIEQLLKRCAQLGAATPNPIPRGIHRDYYPDQVLIDGNRLYVIDFDLYCLGDPALDIGNFIGHLTDHSLRILGDPKALHNIEQAIEGRFIELAGEQTRTAVHAYATLTLVRLIYLSTLFPERRPFTQPLLELCEERLSPRNLTPA